MINNDILLLFIIDFISFILYLSLITWSCKHIFVLFVDSLFVEFIFVRFDETKEMRRTMSFMVELLRVGQHEVVLHRRLPSGA